MNYINTFFESVLHLLYPKVCAGCGADVPGADQLICLSCISELPVTNFHRYAHNPVEKIFLGRLPVEAAAAFVYFSKMSVIQRLLHELKYRGNTEIGLYFGRMMGDALLSSNRFGAIDGLIPLPLHRKKQLVRGYNQATLICQGMAETMQVPVLEEIVIRKKQTATQTKKNRMERWDNTEGRFELTASARVGGKHLLLVDDVITTGATLEACGREILKQPQVKLSIASLAYTTI